MSDVNASDEIKITAEPAADTRSCAFRVDRPISPLSYHFDSAESAKGSTLIEWIFEDQDVESVLVVEDTVTVNVKPQYYANWQPLAVKVGGFIRKAIQTGATTVDDGLVEGLPPEDEIRRRVQEIFDTQINPAVAQHGGVIELLDVKRNVLFIRMGGGCQGCGSANVTLKQGVEKAVRQQIPEVGAILDTTDHASGTNPYYSPSK